MCLLSRNTQQGPEGHIRPPDNSNPAKAPQISDAQRIKSLRGTECQKFNSVLAEDRQRR